MSADDLESAVEESLRTLQGQLGAADFRATFEALTANGVRPYLLSSLEGLKLKMYQERGHTLPHVHIDYRAAHHVASYAISPIRVLQGNLPRSHDRLVRSWLARNQQSLLAVWSRMQAGATFDLELAAVAPDYTERDFLE